VARFGCIERQAFLQHGTSDGGKTIPGLIDVGPRARPCRDILRVQVAFERFVGLAEGAPVGLGKPEHDLVEPNGVRTCNHRLVRTSQVFLKRHGLGAQGSAFRGFLNGKFGIGRQPSRGAVCRHPWLRDRWNLNLGTGDGAHAVGRRLHPPHRPP
jgi:hypothetical protein